MYDQTVRMSNGRKRSSNSGVRAGFKDQRKSTPQDRLLLLQLLVCTALFLVVFVGKGILPSKLLQFREGISSLITADTDFRAAFSKVGEALSRDGAILDKLEEFCVEVFGAGSTLTEATPEKQPQEETSLLRYEQEFLSEAPDVRSLSAHFRSVAEEDVVLAENRPTVTEAAPKPDPEPILEEKAVAAVGTVLLKSDYSGKELPRRYTMDQLSLGALETGIPVLGRITSEFGYRNHPISGKNHFHGGLDISGQAGEAIGAFAAGTVDYVGRDDSYGLYLQLDHGNGVKSFYAHCKKICVTKGQRVELGEKVAEVGSTGSSTGPHLHLELKCGEFRLNPIYYVPALSSQ